MFNPFASRPALDPATSQWLFDCYAWALEHFGSDIFYEDTVLVTATNRHFPDRLDNPLALATAMFERIKGYAAMQGWPFRLEPASGDDQPPPACFLRVQGAPRGPACTVTLDGAARWLPIPYDPAQLRDAERLAAMLAHELAQRLGRTTDVPPPDGEDWRGQATDVLAIFLGFGLFLANHAITLGGGGCGGCKGGPKTLGALMEDEMTYALAIFAVLKDLPEREVLAHLKRSLHPLYRKAVREITRNGVQLERLRAIDRPIKAGRASPP